jgi:hypothetical protein
MFLAFVDRKLISRWVDSEPLQRLFDQRLERGRGVPQGPPGCQKGPALFEPGEFPHQRGRGLFLSYKIRRRQTAASQNLPMV